MRMHRKDQKKIEKDRMTHLLQPKQLGRRLDGSTRLEDLAAVRGCHVLAKMTVAAWKGKQPSLFAWYDALRRLG